MTIARFAVPPIVKTVTVRAAPERAFALFAGDFARWWPLARVHTRPDPVDCAIEPRVGGRVFERAADGRETAWGTVLAYDPPHRLAFSWIVELSAEEEQLVEIRFTAEDRGTRVELTHSGWGKTRRRRSEPARTLRPRLGHRLRAPFRRLCQFRCNLKRGGKP
jgi:uncharacterized protein YndB with AHSA1/START domain